MLSLVELQRWLAERITEAEPGATAATAAGARTGDLVLPSQHLTSDERVAIYHTAYRERLIECLTEDYPALAHALGPEVFRPLALAYIAAHPSRSPNLNFFGQGLSAFCREHALASACGRAPRCDSRAHAADPETLPRFAADLAELEWALVEVLHAPSRQRLSPDSLASVAPEQWARARFLVAPTLRLVSTQFAVNAYYQAFRAGDAPDEPTETARATAVFRDGVTLWRMNLAAPMEQLLRALMSGHTLGQAFDALEPGDLGDDAALQVMTSFREWVGHGFFAEIQLGDAAPAP